MGPRSPHSLGFHTIRLAHQFHCRWDWPEGCENAWSFGASVVKRLALRIPLWIGIFQVSSKLKLNKILKLYLLQRSLKNPVPVVQTGNLFGGQSGDTSATWAKAIPTTPSCDAIISTALPDITRRALIILRSLHL